MSPDGRGRGRRGRVWVRVPAALRGRGRVPVALLVRVRVSVGLRVPVALRGRGRVPAALLVRVRVSAALRERVRVPVALRGRVLVGPLLFPRGALLGVRGALPGLLPALLCLLPTLLCLLLPAPAVAADRSSAGERIAAALRHSPVYVADAYADAVPPARQRELAARIARTGLPIKVVLTPLTRGDAFDGDAEVLAGVVRDRLAQRDLILLTTDGDFPDSLNGFEWPSDTHQTRDAAAAVGFLDELRDAGLADRADKAVDLVARGDGTKVYEEATKDLGGGSGGSGGSGSPAPSAGAKASSSGGRWWPWPALIAVPLLALAVFGLVRLVRVARARRRPRATVRDVVFATARAADEAEVRRRAETEILELGESTRRADPTTTPGLQRALDAYAAAGTVLDAARGLPDLAGALALTAEGRAALASAEGLLCFFNPLHGESATRCAWRPLGRRDRLRVAACASCADAVTHRRPPEVLTDVTADGRRIPYFDVPATRSVWSATGYGSLLRDGDGGLAARVGRGDFRRGRSGR